MTTQEYLENQPTVSPNILYPLGDWPEEGVTPRMPNSFRNADCGLEHKCSTCGAWLPADPENFAVDRKSFAELGSKCHSCARKAAAEWRRDHADLARQQRSRRYARESKASGTFTAEDKVALLEKYGHKCLACGEHESLCGRLIFDHVVSVSKGGSNDSTNRQLLCSRCNLRKGANDIDYRQSEPTVS
jgi:5-methylcytosine-specific restriction endonuclease McrA